jgi:hypothetical protein
MMSLEMQGYGYLSEDAEMNGISSKQSENKLYSFQLMDARDIEKFADQQKN